MSDPSQNRPPQGSGARGPNDPPGFNWRLAILLSAAFLILALAVFSNGMSSTVQSMSFGQFKEKWDQGMVYRNDPKYPLKVTTQDSAYNAVISGHLRTSPERGPGEEPGTTKQVQATLPMADLSAILGESTVFRLSREPAPEPGAETMVLSEAAFRRAAALDEIKPLTDKTPLTVYTQDGNIGVVIANRVIPEAPPAPADGKAVVPKQFKVVAPVMLSLIHI